MKKIMTLCFFAFAMVLGTQTVAAQSMGEINSIASKKTQELKKAIKFSDETEDKVYETYQLYEQKMATVTKTEAEGGTISEEDKTIIKNILNERFKNIFNEREYETYLKIAKDQK